MLRSTPFRSHSRCQALLFSAASLDHNKALRCCIMMRPLRLRTAHPPLPPPQVIQYAPAMFSVEPPANNVFGLCASSNTFFFSSPIQPPALYISTTLWRATKCHFDLRLAPLAAPISFCKKKMFHSPSFLKIIIIVETKKKKTAHLIRVCLLRVFLRHLTDCASTWLVHFTCIFAPWSKRRTNN